MRQRIVFDYLSFRHVDFDGDGGSGHERIAVLYGYSALLHGDVFAALDGGAAAYQLPYLVEIEGITIIGERNSLIFSREIAAAEQTHTRRVVGGQRGPVGSRIRRHFFLQHQRIVYKHIIPVVYARNSQLESIARTGVYIRFKRSVLPRTVIFVQIQLISAVNAVAVPAFVFLRFVVQRVDEQPHPAVFLGEFRFLIINIAHGAVGVKISGSVHISAVYARKSPSAVKRSIGVSARIRKRTAQITAPVADQVDFLLFGGENVLDYTAVYGISHVVERDVHARSGTAESEIARTETFGVIMRHYFIVYKYIIVVVKARHRNFAAGNGRKILVYHKSYIGDAASAPAFDFLII